MGVRARNPRREFFATRRDQRGALRRARPPRRVRTHSALHLTRSSSLSPRPDTSVSVAALGSGGQKKYRPLSGGPFRGKALFSGEAAKERSAADSPKLRPAAPSRTPDGHDLVEMCRPAYEIDVAAALLHQAPMDGAPSLRIVDRTQHGGGLDVLDHLLELVEKNGRR